MFNALWRGLSGAILAIGLAACGSAPPWYRTGANADVMQDDSAQCHAAAAREAERLYPYGYTAPYYGAHGAVMAAQRDAIDRTAAENRAFEACMRNRGYAREPSPENRSIPDRRPYE